MQAWLDEHGPFDAIVDGANIGLYNQNFGEGGFNFFQVWAMCYWRETVLTFSQVR